MGSTGYSDGGRETAEVRLGNLITGVKGETSVSMSRERVTLTRRRVTVAGKRALSLDRPLYTVSRSSFPNRARDGCEPGTG
jgi:hypothetical protein